MTHRPLFVLGILLLCAACSSNDTTTPSDTSTTAPGPGTQSMSAVMAPQGTAMRQFTASAAGTATVTLTSTNPPIVLGLGIGIPGNAVGGCNLTRTVNTGGGTAAQISASVDSGVFCAGAFDIGTTPSNGVLVNVTVVHP